MEVKVTPKGNLYTVKDGVVTMELTQGMQCTFDERDLPLVENHKWHYHLNGKRKYGYAETAWPGNEGTKKIVKMHRLIVSEHLGKHLSHAVLDDIDHKDHNTLNNCYGNIWEAGKKGNAKNRNPKKSRKRYS